jgi:proteic killer suppression protein
MPMDNRVDLHLVAKQLRKVPKHVVKKLLDWVMLVEEEGLSEARKVPGYHDEPLKGPRRHQRSIRLSRQWRAIYTLRGDALEIVRIEEVTPHAY